MNEYNKAIKELSRLNHIFDPEVDYDPDFQELTYEIVESFKQYQNPNDTIRPILECFERQPTSEYGIHAEFFAFVEYLDAKQVEKEVLESINRKPVPQTVWILKMFINSEGFDDKDNYWRLLYSISSSCEVDEETKGTAQMFLEQQ